MMKNGLLTNTTFSHYRVLAPLGAGGMGEVYLAEDDRLRRRVALKVLPDSLAQDADRLRRFEQEALAASALNHPNILTIYEFGSVTTEAGVMRFLASEFIDGETLRDRMQRAPLALNEALDIAVQTAQALAAAHEANIIHRDIKPENVMLRKDGIVKVLDFGLAKLNEERPQAIDSEAATLAKIATDPGAVMGTPQYMSPEQARGQKADARSDLFSLGVVLYEMLAGRPPFTGVNTIEVMGAILNHEPPPLKAALAEMPPALAHQLEHIVAKALRKDREQRYQTSKDLLIDLKDLKEELAFAAKLERSVQPEKKEPVTAQAAAVTTTETTAAATTSSSKVIIGEIKRHRLGVGIVLAIFVVVAAGLGFGLYKMIGQNQALGRAADPASRVVPFTSYAGNECCPSFSPDGNSIAFAWNGEKGDNDDIYVKLIDAGAPLRLTTNPASDSTPAWSPDGRYIAFIRTTKDERGIFLVPALGGQERKLYSVNSANSAIYDYLSWFPDGESLAFSERNSRHEPFSVCLLSVESLEKRKLTSPPVRNFADYSPAISPDGKTLAFIRLASWGTGDLYLVPIAGGEPRRLTNDNRDLDRLAWTPDGREIVFVSDRAGNSSLWTITISGGTPERMAAVSDNVYALAISRQGTRMAYTQYTSDWNIWRMELPTVAGRTSSPTKLIASTRYDDCPQYSADGKRIVFCSNRSGSLETWVCDSDGSNAIQLTFFGGPTAGSPRWSPDGRQIVFDSPADGDKNIYVIRADGGTPRLLTKGSSDNVRPSWSRDGKWVYFGSNRTGAWQVWKAPAEGGPAVQVTNQGGREAFESPDGKYLYYGKALGLTSLWRMSVAGGEEVQILDQVFQGQWAVAEQGVYFLTPKVTPLRTIEFFSFATARTTRITVIKKELSTATGLAVSPDGRWLLLGQNDQTESDIMLMENFR